MHVGLGALGVCGAWLVWNTVQYGDPLAQGAMRRAHAPLAVDATLADLVFNSPFLLKAFTSYWGMLGSMAVPLDGLAYVAFGVLTAAGVAGLPCAIRHRIISRRCTALFVAITGLTVAAFLVHNMHLSAAQGRLLFGAVPSISVLLVTGWAATLAAARAALRLEPTDVRLRRTLDASPPIVLTLILLAINVQTLVGPVQRAFHSGS